MSSPQVSYFKSVKEKKGEAILLSSFLHDIKEGRWKKSVEEIRAEENDEIKRGLKQLLPIVTIAGTFFGARKPENLQQHSGFICIDIDKKDNEQVENLIEIIKKDKYSYASFLSVGGKGIAVVVKVKPEKHQESFIWLQSYYWETYNIKVDPSQQNTNSPRYVSYDPNIAICEGSSVSSFRNKKAKVYSGPIKVINNEELADVVQKICRAGISIAEEYFDYRDIGFSLAEGFGESGRSAFHQICAMSSKYSESHATKLYNEALKRNGAITIATFFWHVKNAGIPLPKNNVDLVNKIAAHKQAKTSKEDVVALLQNEDHLDIKTAEDLATNIFENESVSIEGDRVDKNISPLVHFIKANYPGLHKNAITRKFHWFKGEFKEQDFNSLYLKARSLISKEITKDLIETVLNTDMIPSLNPIAEYIEKNKHRNTNGNIDKLCETIISPTEGKDTYIYKWVWSLIAAHLGYPIRSVLVLIGDQKTGKTHWFEHLLPEEIRMYCANKSIDPGKDFQILMTQKLIIVDDEVGGMTNSDIRFFKDLTSKNFFSVRAPYGRHNEDLKRLAVLCGTSNDDRIINDHTGNTRILPIREVKIDRELYNSINKDDLFMEAYYDVINGAQWELTREEQEILNQDSQAHSVANVEQEMLHKFFGIPEGLYGVEELLFSEIKSEIEQATGQRLHRNRLSEALRSTFGNPPYKDGYQYFRVKRK